MNTVSSAAAGADIQHDLRGKCAVITGSSSGIGRAIALKLAAAGADCLIHGRAHRDEASEVGRQVAALGREASVVLCDLATPEGQDQLLARAWQWRPHIDIWVNNAGADVLTGPAAKLSFEEKMAVLWRVDVMATIRLARAAGEWMRPHGGVILNMGWDQAQYGMAGESGEMFAAVKGAVMAFTRSLARSLSPQVRVNCLAPGWIRTAWAQHATQYWQQRAVSESLLARWGTPDDVAAVACFLASSAASFINGQIVSINGGHRDAEGPVP